MKPCFFCGLMTEGLAMDDVQDAFVPCCDTCKKYVSPQGVGIE